ncbi:virulence protein RhuM/Fic/DOC family protein [Thiobacillus sedimenti]|uniref:Virulence protein RhuM/Fic/DOC family protein n=1 Tax=Thiobacillus sedimenti TaxID=3110231 RepID=A0ABZ1CMV0_9PROT|nr:virulence protein RhuM/Fic/DOC family protein [Thiobacillus sp. SCUT-2]WRS40674.1 virulence protein RhuM/Fic/DOC family protein [Thiobacillus sp. SCUT-2]
MGTGLGEIVLYRAADGGPALDVRLERESVWLSLNQLADLFERDKSVISRHLRNVFKEGELERSAVVAKNATTAADGKTYQVEYFNLDAIISVGYRVNSLRGTQFRIWATNVLRQHLVQGYTVHAQRLKELNQAVRLVADVAHRRTLSGDEASALLEVVADYAYALEVLDDYDHQRVRLGEVSPGPVAALVLDEARQVIARMGERFGASSLFGREKDDGLEGSLSAVMQTFDGQEVYPSLEEKAAHLLYFLVKNHHFVDGNKRIAAALFLWFLQKNQALYRADGGKRIADNALVAMTLLIAESRPDEKGVLTRVVVNLINRRNS